MKNIAFLVGISTYDHQPHLPCCRTDVDAMEALVRRTERFDVIVPVHDVSAERLKEELRSRLEVGSGPIGEIIFYFSGHGYAAEEEFYFCTTDFDGKRPNQTGLSNSEFRALVRAVDPQLVVNIIDACNSGTRLIKRGALFLPADKGGLNNLIQIASCLESQTSLAGEPLSEFTAAFCEAATSKADGPVYYTDIIGALRDRYLGDDNHTPLFTLQAPGRELFVDDIAKLEPFKVDFEQRWKSAASDAGNAIPEAMPLVEEPQTVLEMLAKAEAAAINPERLKALVDEVFDGVAERMNALGWSDLFDLETFESRNFTENNSYAFMTRILSKETRIDEFVTAEIKREKRKRNHFGLASQLLFTSLYDNEDWVENFDLDLNMSMERAQVRFTLKPKFITLQKFTTVISCAPSLERCYVFAVMTRHPRTDWDGFAEEGTEIVKRWFKAPWDQSAVWIVDDVSERIESAVRTYVESLTDSQSGSA